MCTSHVSSRVLLMDIKFITVIRTRYTSQSGECTGRTAAQVYSHMMFLRALLILVSALALTDAHLCLLNPVQRGTMMGINKPAANDCILLKGPCGGRQSRGYPDIAYKAGSNVTVLFQKNLDHFDKSKPGYFSLSIGNSYPGLKEVGRVPDRGEPSLTIYNATVTMPPTPDPFHILQVTYVTNNPQAPPVFYQCSDFRIF